MTEIISDRGFQFVLHDMHNDDAQTRLVSQSSAVGNYDDASDRPGSSFIWIGKHHHLSREEVAKLRDYLTRWLETGELF